jgi:ABC-type multidrug transport system ATPase subunit
MIELQAVSKRFSSTQAVDDLSLTARDGTIAGLLGANGAGKSTTLAASAAPMVWAANSLQRDAIIYGH